MPKVTHYLTLEVGDRVEDIIEQLELLDSEAKITHMQFVNHDGERNLDIEVS